MGRLPRFAFVKFAFTFAFALSTLVLGLDADAGVQWCESDPLFLVNGAIVDVTTAFPDGYKDNIKEPIAIELLVPTNSTALVVSLPTDVPMTAKISKVLPSGGLLSLGVPVVVKVTYKATASFDTRTKVTGTYLWLSSTVYGKSNVTTQVQYTLIGL
ncbi:MAG TPA: hypothetical protein VFA31_09130 [Candidatus Polarisedimenticolia bacterium]|nr:hypothetical protein [Candidatus Polarisedimenticolia bacterium]